MKNEIMALWKSTSKSGRVYFTGKDSRGNKLVGFYGKQKSENSPILQVYLKTQLEEANTSSGIKYPNAICSMWLKTSKNKTKYLSGKMGKSNVVGFINSEATETQPYIKIFESEKLTAEAPKKAPAPAPAPKAKRAEVAPDSEDLPF